MKGKPAKRIRRYIGKAALFILLFPALLLAQAEVGDITLTIDPNIKQITTYVGCTEEPETIGWDAVVDNPATPDVDESLTVDYYLVKVYHFERQVQLASGQVDHPGNQMTINFPWGGHYIVFVWGCRTDWDDPATPDVVESIVKCSDTYNRSDDGSVSMVNGVPGGWWIYRYLCAPTGGGIE